MFSSLSTFVTHNRVPIGLLVIVAFGGDHAFITQHQLDVPGPAAEHVDHLQQRRFFALQLLNAGLVILPDLLQGGIGLFFM